MIRLPDAQVDRLEPHYQSLMGIIGDMESAQQKILKQLEAQLGGTTWEGGDAA